MDRFLCKLHAAMDIAKDIRATRYMLPEVGTYNIPKHLEPSVNLDYFYQVIIEDKTYGIDHVYAIYTNLQDAKFAVDQWKYDYADPENEWEEHLDIYIEQIPYDHNLTQFIATDDKNWYLFI